MAQPTPRRTRAKTITISHPRLTAWAWLGNTVRISLRWNPVTVSLADGPLDSPVIAVTPVSGPFPRRADGQQDK
ncbi:MAG: hypothetical protein SFV19_20365 [Rhodospirillaceae bacterium]|nr:hypothetical protein [Rhodospirillaceae bacterium]